MLTHAQIWQGLDRLAEAYGYSPSGLARAAGLDPTSFNKSKRISADGKPRWLSTESLAKVLTVTGCTMTEFLKFLDEPSFPALTQNDRKAMSIKAAKILIKTESVLFNAKNPYVLKSGKKSPVYVDCRRLISFVEERDELMNFGARLLATEVGAANIDSIAGGETAGIPYSAFIADRLRKPNIYVRKQPKGYGRMAQIEGVLPEKNTKGKKPRVVLVEDLQTDGGSKKIFIDALRDAGAEIAHTFVVFHYGIFAQSEQNMRDMGVKLHALCTWWDVFDAAKEGKYFDNHTHDSVEAFLNDPIKWQTDNA